MATKRHIEIFTVGCACCDEAVQIVERVACSSCEVTVLDMKEEDVARRAQDLGIRSVPSVVIDGKLAECCVGRGVNEETLLNAGVGQAM